MDVKTIIDQQQRFFLEGRTRPLTFRKEQLQLLKRALRDSEQRLMEAIEADFGKSRYETYQTELAMIYHEINLVLRRLDRWASKKRVSTNLANFPGRSYLLPEPLGTVLIIGAWNYPYQLTLVPLVSAMAAGNTAIVKPSELPAQTSRAMAEILNAIFPPEYVLVQEGGVPETTELLQHRFDKIFFTGSTAVGRIVAQAAAKHLTPVTLELGGKSPVFVLPDADLRRTAQRIVWGKFLNAGQTCIAPDYVLVDQAIEAALVQDLKEEIEARFGRDGSSSEAYVRIIHQRHFERLLSLIDPRKVVCGGTSDRERLFLAPTLMKGVSFSDSVMTEEIFGPLLPVISYHGLDEAIASVKSRPKPLALYIFTRDGGAADRILSDLSFGGGSVNDTVTYISNSALPFGGVGESGMGKYHGEAGFREFSHVKSILKRSLWFEPSLKYPPYTPFKMKLLRFLME